MSGFFFVCLNDPRVAAHALSPSPAWLWSTDGARVLWANAAGTAIFEARPPHSTATSFDSKHPVATQIVRLAGTLPATGAPRLERLRGFGASLGSAQTFLCSRITLADNTAAILIVATERTSRELPLAERAERLLDDFESPAAVFTADGELIYAMPTARDRLGESRDLIALGAEKLAREAMLNGSALGELSNAPASLQRLGAGGSVVALLLTFIEAAQAAAPVEEPQTDTAQARRQEPAARPADEAPRRFPFRFVWQMDADTHFTIDNDELVALLGSRTAALLGQPWVQIAAALDLDPQGQVAAAIEARSTWSGLVVQWPVDDQAGRLPIELSGLPVFDRERQFAGFRGFGICRDVARLGELERRRAEPGAPQSAIQESPPPEPPKVLPFPPAPALSPGEHSAFQELARKLGERLKNPVPADEPASDDFGPEPVMPSTPETPLRPVHNDSDAYDVRTILDRLPVGILVYRLNTLLYANRAFLVWAEQPTLQALTEAGGLDTLFIETTNAATRDGAKRMSVTNVGGKQQPVEGQLFGVVWNGENALALMVATQPSGDSRPKQAAASQLRQDDIRELEAVLDTATDGVLMLDKLGHILSANRSAQALFGYGPSDITKLSLGDLLAPESRRDVLDHLGRLARNGGPESLDAGRETIGLVRQGGLVPLFITMGRIADGEKFCAVLRDITAWKRTEEELINARQDAEKSSAAKSEFLAKLSHEIRTPLNAIIGFSEVMMDERFGSIGNERYRQYLKDIHASGGHLISLLNDLLDLSKIEAGRLELNFVAVNLNDIVQQCVAIMQQQANRERIIIRTSLLPRLPQVVADARSVRQVTLNLLSNSIKFTAPGGQVIISTSLTDDSEVVLRVRDTGAGMNSKELQMTLEPFGQAVTTSPWSFAGSGLGLPITKALAEANHARFHITSQPKDGTLAEIAFPVTRILTR